MAQVGYARVSTHEQNLDLQRDALESAGVKLIYEDKASGGTLDRPELSQCLKALREGDTLTVWRLDRLGRTLSGLVSIVNDLGTRGIAFRSLKESIDTQHSAGKLAFHMFAAMAEFERDVLRERTLAGLAAARARGRKGGRRPSLNPSQSKAAVAMMKNKDMAVGEIAAHFGVSRSTLHKLAARSRETIP
ncbi:recombinase family protein [Achromobacter animicus]|uniref:recombinase family protein n=1 Tax=Achromobacter animicus TaxID=1389935 RepID=UPI0028AA7E9F|nr:recombinase family protein [Achromobacter animicus]